MPDGCPVSVWATVAVVVGAGNVVVVVVAGEVVVVGAVAVEATVVVVTVVAGSDSESLEQAPAISATARAAPVMRIRWDLRHSNRLSMAANELHDGGDPSQCTHRADLAE